MNNVPSGSGGSTLIDSGYLQRLRQRQDELMLKHRSVFGMVGGLLLVVIFGFKYLYMASPYEELWGYLVVVGLVLGTMGLAVPLWLGPVEAAFRSVAGVIGHAIMTVFITAMYYVAITPVGMLWGAVSGRAPFFAWDEKPEGEGWMPKEISEDEGQVHESAASRSLLWQPLLVVGYFINQGRWILIPAVILLISFGLLLFFVKSSSLAPFIYTLF